MVEGGAQAPPSTGLRYLTRVRSVREVAVKNALVWETQPAGAADGPSHVVGRTAAAAVARTVVLAGLANRTRNV
jgi:hypothetical protein